MLSHKFRLLSDQTLLYILMNKFVFQIHELIVTQGTNDSIEIGLEFRASIFVSFLDDYLICPLPLR